MQDNLRLQICLCLNPSFCSLCSTLIFNGYPGQTWRMHGLGIILLLLSYRHQRTEFEVDFEVECALRISLTQLTYNGVSSPVADLCTFVSGLTLEVLCKYICLWISNPSF